MNQNLSNSKEIIFLLFVQALGLLVHTLGSSWDRIPGNQNIWRTEHIANELLKEQEKCLAKPSLNFAEREINLLPALKNVSILLVLSCSLEANRALGYILLIWEVTP